jgi:hypothetical protein
MVIFLSLNRGGLLGSIKGIHRFDEKSTSLLTIFGHRSRFSLTCPSSRSLSLFECALMIAMDDHQLTDESRGEGATYQFF